MKLSVAIATHNEEKHIKDCLESVKFADEVVVVDGESTDKTAELAKKAGAKVLVVQNQPLMKKNINLAFSKCHGDWIFSLDADERISTGLKEEILEVIQGDNKTAYKIPRKNIIFGKEILHTGWYPDYQSRLFKNGKAKFPAENVHEELIVDGESGVLTQPIIHYHYHSISEWILRMDKYTTIEAEKLIKEGKKVRWQEAIGFPFQEFLSRFFDREGYKDGLHGLVLSILMAFYWEIIFAKVWEYEGFWQYESAEFLREVEKESGKVSHDWRHWMMVSDNKKIRKLVRKVSNKLWLK